MGYPQLLERSPKGSKWNHSINKSKLPYRLLKNSLKTRKCKISPSLDLHSRPAKWTSIKPQSCNVQLKIFIHILTTSLLLFFRFLNCLSSTDAGIQLLNASFPRNKDCSISSIREELHIPGNGTSLVSCPPNTPQWAVRPIPCPNYHIMCFLSPASYSQWDETCEIRPCDVVRTWHMFDYKEDNAWCRPSVFSGNSVFLKKHAIPSPTGWLKSSSPSAKYHNKEVNILDVSSGMVNEMF